MLGLEGRVIIVTGGAHGLGRAYCEAFGEARARVAVADIQAEPARAVAAGIGARGGSALAVAVDVTDEASVLGMAAEVLGAWGRIDVLVNNAAIVVRFGENPRQPFDQVSVAEWERTMAVNVRGPWLCARAVFPAMKAQGGGKIVNIASGTIFSGAPFWIHYGTSKAAVVGLSRSLARELGPHNIAVNVLSPSLTQTDATEKVYGSYFDEVAKMRCFQRRQVPADLIGAMLFLASDASNFMTGQLLNVDGGAFFH